MDWKNLSYELGPIRPPNEARSLLLRLTRNCPWNQCLFCPVYKRRKFSLRTVDEIKQDIQAAKDIADDIQRVSTQLGCGGDITDEVVSHIFNQTAYNDTYRSVAAWLYYKTDACFLQDADNLIMKTKDLVSSLLVALLLMAMAFSVEANGDTRGFDIAARSDRTDLGFSDSDVELTMVLRNAAGQESTRSLRIATLEKPDETVGDKSLVVFDTPRDIEGTALLSHAKILDPDDQWLFLPALKRVKRISSANKSGPFVGSEFAFEDFTAIELNKFDYTYVGEEPCGDLMCDVVERTPRYENSGYTKQMSWVDQIDYQLRKVEFYDRRGDLLKVLELSDYRDYDGIWRAH